MSCLGGFASDSASQGWHRSRGPKDVATINQKRKCCSASLSQSCQKGLTLSRIVQLCINPLLMCQNPTPQLNCQQQATSTAHTPCLVRWPVAPAQLWHPGHCRHRLQWKVGRPIASNGFNGVSITDYQLSFTIWLFNIAMENPQNKWRFQWENHL
jgi:hypothetical protein